MRRCAPGRGTSAAYRGPSLAYYRAAAAVAQRANLARALAEARQAQLLKQAATDAARLALADNAYKEGDIRVASRMYVRIALSRPKNPSTEQAKQRLDQLAEEARQKLRDIDIKLSGPREVVSPGESAGPSGPPPPQMLATRWEDVIPAAFQQYDDVAHNYNGVPAVKHEIRRRIAGQRRRPEFAAVLNEPEAKALWESGQQHEQDDNLCCAYWVYERAARLRPAPSAQRAYERLAQLKQDPKVVASAEVCREVQRCHDLFNRAERLVKAKPARAKELFAQIVQRAPEDSEVYQAAQRYVEQIR